MSRSKKFFPVSQWACGSDGPFKRMDKRRYRHAMKQLATQVGQGKLDYDGIVFPPLRQYSNPWNWPSDGGKHYRPLHQCTPKCQFDDFATEWCEWRRKWDKKRMRK